MLSRLGAIPNLHILENVPLSRYTRFAIGGPARVLADASTDQALGESLQVIQEGGCPHTVIGGGANLIASEDGYARVVLRYTAPGIEFDGDGLHVDAGRGLQELADAN